MRWVITWCVRISLDDFFWMLCLINVCFYLFFGGSSLGMGSFVIVKI